MPSVQSFRRALGVRVRRTRLRILAIKAAVGYGTETIADVAKSPPDYVVQVVALFYRYRF